MRILLVPPLLPEMDSEAGCEYQEDSKTDVYNGCDEDKHVDLMQGGRPDGRPVVRFVLAFLPSGLHPPIALYLDMHAGLDATAILQPCHTTF